MKCLKQRNHMIKILAVNKNIYFLVSILFFFGCRNTTTQELAYFVEYYEDSTIMSQGFTVNGIEHGYFSYYNSGGMIIKEGVFTNGIRNGTWRFYDFKGLYMSADYCYGKLYLVKEYENGKLTGIVNVVNNEIWQVKRYYYNNNQPSDSVWMPIKGAKIFVP